MSRSCVILSIKFLMLDKNHDTCNKEYADTSAGHTEFVYAGRLRVGAPDTCGITSEEYNREAWVDSLVEQTLQDFASKEKYNNMTSRDMLKSAYTHLLKQAEEHIISVHKVPVKAQ